MNTILAPIDFSGVSRSVVAEAARLARFAKARIVLMHVVQLPVLPPDYTGLFENIEMYTAAAEKSADRNLSGLKVKLRAGGIPVKTVRLTGFPAPSILEQAKTEAANYIVIGSHGHTAFYDLLIGGTASGVLKRAACPVVVVPSPKNAPGKAKR
jgi:nucleotide-binding universal stress UspA family protein